MSDTMRLRMDNGAILAYQRLSYRTWYAIAEFVDNAVDSYLRPKNKARLDEVFAEEGRKLEVEVSYDRNNRTLLIDDNSIGMSAEELEQALVIGSPPKSAWGLSEFGMGMKTSAIWFADEFEIRTKKLGENYEIRVTIDVQKFAQGKEELTTSRSPKSPEQHYTLIKLNRIKRTLGPSALEKTQAYLGSIYRDFLRNGEFSLTVDGRDVDLPPARGDDAFMTRSDGSPLVVDVDLDVNGKTVTGWVGVLKPGFTGRSKAGFALLRHRRAVNGWIDSWRPQEIFGDARNDTLNQRLAGELFVDGFRASHTKDAIDWVDDDEEQLGEKIDKLCRQYNLLIEAKKKTRGSERTEEEEREHLEALEQLRAQLNDQRVSDVISILDVPTPDLVRVQTEPLQRILEEAEGLGMDPVLSWPVSKDHGAHLFEVDLSPNDPYFYFEVLEDRDLRVVVNKSHPAVLLLGSPEARLAHYHHVVLEAIAEWQVAQQRAEIRPESIRLMKDRLFRSVAGTPDD